MQAWPHTFQWIRYICGYSEVWSHVPCFSSVGSEAAGLLLPASECSQEMHVCHRGRKPGLAWQVVSQSGEKVKNTHGGERDEVQRGRDQS